jgi:hypothetical protein
MPARRTALRQLFSKGQVTDVDSADLAPDMAESLRDVVWTANGDLSKRGGFLYATGANPVDANTDPLLGCAVFPTESTTTPGDYTYRLVVTDNQGRVGVLSGYTYSYGTPNSSTASLALLPLLAAYPVMLWQDELILTRFDSTRNRMTYRWGGSIAAEDATPSGTVALTANSDVVTGTATAFTSEVTVGQYLNVTDATVGLEYCFRVEFIESDTLLRVSGKSQVAVSGNYTVTNFGYPNISTLVTDKGTVTTAATTATGKATDWTGGLDEVIANHLGASWLAGTAATTRYAITTLTDDNTLTLAAAAGLTNSNYVIGMPLAGHIITDHAGRLWIAGVPWAPNRLQVTPVGHNLSDVFNGIDSSTTDPDNAAVIESIEIPDDKSPGFITALASGNDPGPLLVLRDRDAYIVYGEWPAVQVTKLGEDIGCSDWRGVTFHDRTFYWASLEGVFSYTPGGGVRNLTEGRIYREWKAQIGVDEVDSMVVAVVNRTLFVSVGLVTNTDFAYMYDIDRGAWSTLTDGQWSHAMPVVFAGEGRDVFVTERGTNRIVSLAAATDPAYAGTGNSLQGSFLARSGRMLMGSAGDLGRVVDSRVTYRMTSGSSPQFTVKYGSVSLNTAATVTTTTSGTAYATTRIKPGSTNLGTSARDMQVEFAESSGTPARLEINEFSWVTRERRKRA